MSHHAYEAWLVLPASYVLATYGETLTECGMTPRLVETADQAEQWAVDRTPGLAILDARPGRDACAVVRLCERLRSAWEGRPVTLLAIVEVTEGAGGQPDTPDQSDTIAQLLNAGVDDVLIEPLPRSLRRSRIRLASAPGRATALPDRPLELALEQRIERRLQQVFANTSYALANAPYGVAGWKSALRAAQRGASDLREIASALGSARDEDLTAGLCDFSRLVKDAVSAISAGYHVLGDRVALDLSLPDQPVWIDVPAAAVTDVILQVLDASVESVDSEPDPRVHIAIEPGPQAVLSVDDNGSGFAPHQLTAAFRDAPARGLRPVTAETSLAECNRRIARLGGEFEVRSQVGSGTSYRIALPAAGTPSGTGRRQARPTRVLIIDDDALVLDAIARMLKNFDVATAISVSQARPQLADADVILCDILLPDTDGPALYDSVNAQIRDRMVFMTGSAFSPRACSFLERVPNARLEKPLDPKQLLLILDTVARR